MVSRSHSAVFVIIAAYNEESMLAEVIANVGITGHQVIVVVDGATDATAEVAANAGAIVVKHPFNLGQGAALQTGIEFALSRGAKFLITFDADGQHDAADIAHLLDALSEHNADFALGSRFLTTTFNTPRSRTILLQAATWFTRVTTGLSITDTHNGLRAMSRRGANVIRLRQNRMAHATEILHQISGSGLKYVEVPVTIRYSRYSQGKGQRFSASINILLDLFAHGLRR